MAAGTTTELVEAIDSFVWKGSTIISNGAKYAADSPVAMAVPSLFVSAELDDEAKMQARRARIAEGIYAPTRARNPEGPPKREAPFAGKVRAIRGFETDDGQSIGTGPLYDADDPIVRRYAHLFAPEPAEVAGAVGRALDAIGRQAAHLRDARLATGDPLLGDDGDPL